MIIGSTGSGKSTLALQLISLGATLVADDGVMIHSGEGALRLSAPVPIRDRIEARGFGILATPSTDAVARAVVDLDTVETSRLPAPRETVIAGVPLPLFAKVESPAFPAMLRLWLDGGLVT